MALISHLVREMADMTRTDEARVAGVARYLREAGLISQKGHGRGAAHASPLDAARLLIALMIDGKALDAPQAVRDFGGLVNHFAETEPGRTYSDFNLSIFGLSHGHKFEDAMAAVIEMIFDPDRAELMGRSNILGSLRFKISIDCVLADVTIGASVYAYTDPDHAKTLVDHTFPDYQERMQRPEYHQRMKQVSAVLDRYKTGIRKDHMVIADELARISKTIWGQ